MEIHGSVDRKIIERGVFIADEEGLRLRAMDTSHVVMVDLFYPSSAFVEYNVSGEAEFGVSFSLLTKGFEEGSKG
ncbi:MAG: hypothetical protein Q9N34_00500 [Aquificota bacterium]|nr:hypothetical protein [Aquificota bacterium]